MISFTKTLAIEGAKYNIIANCIAPIAASQMLASVMPPEILENLKPEMVAPLATYLVSGANTEHSGLLIESGAGFMAGVRRERSRGVVFRADDTFTPSAVGQRIDEILDFDESPEYPEKITDANHLEFLERAKEAKANDQGEGKVRFDGKTVLITGAGAGLGKAYAVMFAKLGANVVVNDFAEKNANAVVEEIKKAGGKAAPAIGSAENGEKLVKDAVDAFGGLHVVINNAGILRDKSFASMSDDEWHAVMNVHLRGTYSVCKAAWPIFQQQKYGRIVNTTSAVGIYGNFGQANYSTAKGGILGLTQTLAIEGQKYGILANTIAPNAGTAMTSTIWPQEMVDAFKPDFVAPAVGYLASEANEEVTKGLFEVSGGWVAAVRWQRSGGHAFKFGKSLEAEVIEKNFSKIIDYDPERASWPATNQESIQDIMANITAGGEDDDEEEGGDEESYIDDEDPDFVKEAKSQPLEPVEYSWDEDSTILYNLGIGATAQELKYVYEGDDEFQLIPSAAVIIPFEASSGIPMDWLPNFDPTKLLHGEQSVEFKVKELPTSGKVTNHPRIAEVLDKGKAASIAARTKTVDGDGKELFSSHSVVFIRGAGDFKGKKQGRDWGAASAQNKPPSRKPDFETDIKTGESQAALYRLSGDKNPLHVDPSFASMGGFEKPILHGLCSLGVSVKALYEKFGFPKAFKVRFAGTLLPGQTIQLQAWKEGTKVVWEAKCKETGAPVISAGGYEVWE